VSPGSVYLPGRWIDGYAASRYNREGITTTYYDGHVKAEPLRREGSAVEATETRPAGVTTRRYGARGRGFKIDGVKAPGVTKILDMLPNDNLIGWAARVTAEYALDHWVELSAMSPSARLRTLEKSRWDNTSKPALARGTEVHHLGEGLIAGETVELPGVAR
jgi:hypothetical protein